MIAQMNAKPYLMHCSWVIATVNTRFVLGSDNSEGRESTLPPPATRLSQNVGIMAGQPQMMVDCSLGFPSLSRLSVTVPKRISHRESLGPLHRRNLGVETPGFSELPPACGSGCTEA
jgi:hypothetical protein